MCGLSGAMSSTLNGQELNMFKDLLNISSLRGSTGAGVIVNQDTYKPVTRVLRTTQISGALAYSEKMQELLQPRVNCVVGHARLPTKGGVEIEHVHPHRFGHIIGVHNGTMWKVGGEYVKDQSDSAMLFKSFSEQGVVKTIEGSEGAYALVWIDEKERTLNFLRNSQRTLFFKNIGWGAQGNKNASVIYWASEKEMLDLIFARSYRNNNHWDTYLPVDTWFKYPLDIKHVIRTQEVVQNVRPLPQKPKPATGNVTGRGRTDIFDDDQLPFREGGGTDLTWVRGAYRHNNGERSNVICLPDRSKAATTLPAPAKSGAELSAMSKQARKAYLRKRKEQEKDALKRLETFRAANMAFKADMEKAKKTEGIDPHAPNPEPPVADPTPMFPRDLRRDANNRAPFHARGDDVSDVCRERIPVRIAGSACAWCGETVSVGEKVFLVSADLGANRTFICDDCGTKEYAYEYAELAKLGVVVN
jgi:hypothetical protein